MDFKDIKNVKSVQAMIETRMKAEEKNGNYTEKSFLFTLWQMAEEFEKLKKKDEQE